MQDFGHVFEATRLRQVTATLEMLRQRGLSPQTLFDYGCGEGKWFAPVRSVFPNVSIGGSDISPRALQVANELWPIAELILMDDERVSLPDRAFDFVISIEVLEHVAQLGTATAEIARLVAPGGYAVIITPCANPGSFEWAYNRVRGDSSGPRMVTGGSQRTIRAISGGYVPRSCPRCS